MSDTSSSQALTKRNADTSLMPPPPPPKRIKRPTKVLDEDVYTDALSHIIARDFFPGLLETQAQSEYLEALDSQNNDWIREAGRKLHQAMTPGPGGRGRRGTSMAQTPRGTQTSDTPRAWEGETPRRTAVSATPALSTTSEDERPKHQVDASLSLGAFQTKYTSEDNESFNALLDKQNIKRAEKYAFLYAGNKIPTARQLEYRSQQSQKLLESSTSQSLVPLRPSQNLDDRPAAIDGFKTRQGAKNSFMFAPDSVEDSLPTLAQAAADRSLAPPKAVKYAATRLPTAAADDSSASSIPASPSMSAVDAAIAGYPRPSSTDAGYADSETPRVAGYAFVDTEPEPHELVGRPVSDEQADREDRDAAMALMLRANDGESGRGGFKLQDASRREELHHRIVDRQNSARRKPGADRLGALVNGGATPGRTPTPSFASARNVVGARKTSGNLTPAARMLAASIGRTPGRELSGGLFGEKRESGKSRAWTPTPRVKRG